MGIRYISLLIVSLLLNIPTHVVSGIYNEMNLVLLFPVIKARNKTHNVKDISGIKRLAAAIMAIEHVNDKTDGFYDHLVLPRFKYFFYDSKRSTERSWWNVAQFSSLYHENKNKEAYVIVGPASSSPSLAVNEALTQGNIMVPQVGYSASSPKLSNQQLFIRTVPNDILKAKLTLQVAYQDNVFFPCIIHGNDEYSRTLATEFIKEYSMDFDSDLLTVSSFITGETASSTQLNQIFCKLFPSTLDCESYHINKEYQEIFKVCNAIVLFVQSQDGEHILEHIIEKKKRQDVRIYGTETLTGIFFNYIKNYKENAKSILEQTRIIDIAVPFNTSSQYKKLKDAWHDKHANCSIVDDRDKSCLLGSKKFVFRPASDDTYKDSCVAFNYSDYKLNKDGFEVSGSGYIDSHVPYSYDAIIAIAEALNSRESNKSKIYDAASLHAKMINVTFEGFSGTVQFNAGGDRLPKSVNWNIFTFENNEININNCNIDKETDRYKVSYKSKSNTFKPYQPDCKPEKLQFKAFCNESEERIQTLVIERKNCVCYNKECYNCCYLNKATFIDKLSFIDSHTNKMVYKYHCPYVPVQSPWGIGMYFLGSFTIIINALIIVLSFAFRNSSTLKNSQVYLLIFMLFGAILVSMFTFLGIGKIEKWSCTFGMWLLHLGLTMIIVSMYTRTWRIHTIFNNQKLRRKVGTSVNMKILWPKIGVFFFVLVSFLIFRTFSSFKFVAAWKLAQANETILPGLADAIITSHRCTLDGQIDLMMYTIYIILIVQSLFYTYKVKDVSLRYQDSAYVGAFWLSAIILFVFFAIVGLITAKRVQKDAMIRVGINIELMVLSGLLLVPKLLHVSKVFGGEEGIESKHGRKSKIEKLQVDNLDLQSDNAMNMQTILELTNEIENLKSQASGRGNGMSAEGVVKKMGAISRTLRRGLSLSEDKGKNMQKKSVNFNLELQVSEEGHETINPLYKDG